MNEEMIPCEACLGTGGLELNGGTSMSNEYFECDVCEGIGEIPSHCVSESFAELLSAFGELIRENPKVLEDQEPKERQMPEEGEFIGE